MQKLINNKKVQQELIALQHYFEKRQLNHFEIDYLLFAMTKTYIITDSRNFQSSLATVASLLKEDPERVTTKEQTNYLG